MFRGKVGETITANPVPANADTTGLTYAWSTSASTDTTAVWTPLLGATTNTFKVTSAEVDKFIKVTVTDGAGKTYEAATTTAVQADASADVALVDDYGLQSDGTGIIGDKLTVTYGATFGTPTNVSWYKDGKVVATNSVGDQVNNGLTRTISASNWGTGTYKVTITNTEGTMATTNEIIITDKEDVAVIKDFTLEDDYTDGTDVDYGTKDNRVIATVTMNKNYEGTFRVYKATDTKYTSPIANDTLTTSVDQPVATAAQAITAMWVPAGGGAAVGIADEFSVLCTNAPTNYNVLNAAVLGSGYGYISNDGTVTYKWVLNTNGLDRGSEYVVTFDQASISSDTPSTGTANVSEKFVAPYVTVPAKLEVKKVAAGVNPEMEFQDENGASLGWFGYKNTLAAADHNGVAAGAESTLADMNAKEAAVYGATSKTTNPKDSGVTALELPTVGAADTVVKGTWKATASATNLAYWFATVTFNKGVFGAEEVTITSEAKANAQGAATDMDVLEDKDTGSTAVVKFSNLRADGTLYIVRAEGNDTGVVATGTISASQEAAMDNGFKLFDPDNSNTYRKSVKVAAGTLEVKVEGAIDSVKAADANTGNYAEELTNAYGAVFIPDDQTNYGKIMTDDIAAGTIAAGKWASNDTAKTAAKTPGTVGGPVVITQKLAKYELANLSNNDGSVLVGGTPVANVNGALSATVASGNAYVIKIKDQFTKEITPAGTQYDKIWSFKTANSEGVQDNVVTLSWDSAATAKDEITVSATTGTELGAGIKYFQNGEKYTATTSTGQTITLTVKTAAATAGDGNNTNDGTVDITTTWVIAIN